MPNALAVALSDHKDLGLHTEMFADGILRLIKKGVINGRRKKIDTGKVVASFLLGSDEVYKFIDHNPDVLMKDIKYTNDPWVISQNPCMTAINSAIEVDFTGQICADSIGTRMFSGTGGQVDFVSVACTCKMNVNHNERCRAVCVWNSYRSVCRRNCISGKGAFFVLYRP